MGFQSCNSRNLNFAQALHLCSNLVLDLSCLFLLQDLRANFLSEALNQSGEKAKKLKQHQKSIMTVLILKVCFSTKLCNQVLHLLLLFFKIWRLGILLVNRALGHLMPRKLFQEKESCISQSTIRPLKALATVAAEQCPNKKIKSSVIVTLHVRAHSAVFPQSSTPKITLLPACH